MTTRAQIEAVLVRRRRKQMVFVGMDAVTVDGTNSDLTDSIGSAILFTGGSVTDITAVTDADLLTIPDLNKNAVYDVAEMYLISSIRSSITSVDEVTGPFAAKLSQLPDRLLADWKLLKQKIEDDWNLGGPDVEVGTILQDFATHNEGINDTDIS